MGSNIDGKVLMSIYIIAGFGFRQRASVSSLADALARVSDGMQITGLAAPADKCTHTAMQELSAELDLPLYPIDPMDLKAKVTPSLSEAALSARGTGSVAEASALIAAGPTAILMRTREISTDRLAVCAIAKGDKK